MARPLFIHAKRTGAMEPKMIKIVGAGMAGLLAANLLSKRGPTVIEAQPKVPNNHSAVLRFRSSIVGDSLGIPFRKVQMIKAALPWKNPVADALAYSFKNTGVSRSDRSIISGLTVAERFIAPHDLIPRMVAGAAPTTAFQFNEEFAFTAGWPVISTIPMPALMKLLGYECDQNIFQASSGINFRARIAGCDAYVSLMIPDPWSDVYRISVTGDELIVECVAAGGSNELYIGSIVEEYLGISSSRILDVQAHRMQYAKILPIDEAVRKDFLFWATDKFNVFSLGRFATWRPDLLMDDLVNDIRKIDGWIDRGNRYNAMRSRS
jgi:hypothetical protein